MCIQLPDCESNNENLGHLSDCTVVCLSDPDCGDNASLEKVNFDGFCDKDCGINIPPACFSADDLKAGVAIGDLGTLQYVDGKLTFTADPTSPDSIKLGAGELADLHFTAVAVDTHGCENSTCFNVNITGGNDAPEIKVGDMCIQLPDCCNPYAAHIVDCTPVCLSDPDCGDQACLEKVTFAGFCDKDCGINIPPACYSLEQLLEGVQIDCLGTLMYDGSKLTFTADPTRQESIHLAGGELVNLCFTATAIDSHGCETESDPFHINITGGNDAPTIDCSITPPCIEDCSVPLTGNILIDGHAHDPDCGDVITVASVNGVTDGGAGDADHTVNGHIVITDQFGTLDVAADGIYSFKENCNNTCVSDLTNGQDLKLNYDVIVTDGKCTADTKLDICIEGHNGFFIPSDFSNVVLYLKDDNYLTDGNKNSPVLKVIFDHDSGSLAALDTNHDGLVSSSEIQHYIDNPTVNLGGHTDLIAFSVHNGNFAGTTPYNTGYEPNNGSNIGNTNGNILHAGEGQLVFMDNSGFEVANLVPPADASLPAAQTWLSSLQNDVTFAAAGTGYTSSQLAGSILDPHTALGAAILAGNAVSA
jgi:VCBS repeat-containing protein